MKNNAILIFLILISQLIYSQDWRVIKIKEWEIGDPLPNKIISNKYLYEYYQNETQVSKIATSTTSVLHKVNHSNVIGNRLMTSTYRYGQYLVVYSDCIIFLNLEDGTLKRSLKLEKTIKKVLSLNVESDELVFETLNEKYFRLNLCDNSTVEIEVEDDENEEHEIDTFFNNIDTINLGGDYYLEVVGNKCFAYHKTSHLKSEIFSNDTNFIQSKVFVNKSGNKLFLKGMDHVWIINKKLDIDTILCNLDKISGLNASNEFFIDDNYYYGLCSESNSAPYYFIVMDLKTCEIINQRKITENPFPSLYINDSISDRHIFYKFQFPGPLNQPVTYYNSYDIETNSFGGGSPFAGIIGGPGFTVGPQCGDYYLLLKRIFIPLGLWKFQVFVQKKGSLMQLLSDFDQDFASSLVEFSECQDKSVYFTALDHYTHEKKAIWLFEYEFSDTMTIYEDDPLNCKNDIIYVDNLIYNDIVYSNVVNNVIKVKYDLIKLNIYNVYGSEVESFSNIDKDENISINLNRGIYLLKGIGIDKKVYTGKIIQTP